MPEVPSHLPNCHFQHFWAVSLMECTYESHRHPLLHLFFRPSRPGRAKQRGALPKQSALAMRHVFVRDLAGQTLTLQTDEQVGPKGSKVT